jgi:hypothetical protein
MVPSVSTHELGELAVAAPEQRLLVGVLDPAGQLLILALRPRQGEQP